MLFLYDTNSTARMTLQRTYKLMNIITKLQDKILFYVALKLIGCTGGASLPPAYFYVS
jgi:hypothetical protein